MSKKLFSYQIQGPSSGRAQNGELEAKDLNDARRRLRGLLGVLKLPPGTTIQPSDALDGQRAQARSAKLRHLLKVLGEHHEWLKGKGVGARADLSGLNLTGVALAKKNLSHADLAAADLSGADLAGATLSGANMVRTNLVGANLRNADLSGADLTEADLRDAILTGAKLQGVDFWRANLKGCAISPKALHAALECR
ncbi:MAG: pentapeptide repeat-containing protein [Kiloniellales bacterium]|nr:pentapeptide repeat-containing protein [Kiloniellales bacterium]